MINQFTPDRIRQLRERLGWSQRQLAKELHLHWTAISQWEQGLTSPSGPARVLLSRLENRAGRREKKISD